MTSLRVTYPTYRWLSLLLLLLVTLVTFAQDNIPERPNPPRLVNDLVGILNPNEKEQLEQKLRAYNDSTSTQITVVIVKTTDPYPIGDYAFQLGRKWGVGQQEKNNGLVLCWATGTRKVFIATGYGLEGAIPDAIAKRIVSNIIVPNFRQEQYYKGLDEATTEIIRRASGEYKSDGSETDDGEGGSALFIVLIVFFIIIFIISRRNRGGGGGIGSRRGGWFFPYTTFSGWGSSSGNWGGGGGFGGGSDFGGFGGGSFGGGGAGGDY